MQAKGDAGDVEACCTDGDRLVSAQVPVDEPEYFTSRSTCSPLLSEID
jgi:hypothetical protein